MKFGLEEEDVDAICRVNNYPQISRAIIYGSRAKGNFRAASDIDLTLDGQNLDLLFQVENELVDFLLLWKIDLSLLSKIENPELVEHIERVGKVFFDRNAEKIPQ